mgnify:CR=1 FL=1
MAILKAPFAINFALSPQCTFTGSLSDETAVDVKLSNDHVTFVCYNGAGTDSCFKPKQECIVSCQQKIIEQHAHERRRKAAYQATDQARRF